MKIAVRKKWFLKATDALITKQGAVGTAILFNERGKKGGGSLKWGMIGVLVHLT